MAKDYKLKPKKEKSKSKFNDNEDFSIGKVKNFNGEEDSLDWEERSAVGDRFYQKIKGKYK